MGTFISRVHLILAPPRLQETMTLQRALLQSSHLCMRQPRSGGHVRVEQLPTILSR